MFDSGASGCEVHRDVPSELGLEPVMDSWYRIYGVNGRQTYWYGVRVPKLDVGELAVRDIPCRLSDHGYLIGTNVMEHGPWELDLDRGVLEIGARPWERRSDDTEAPLETAYSDDPITVTINGHDVLMELDTGATGIMLDDETADAIGLERRKLEHPRMIATIHEVFEQDEVLVAETVAIGDAVLENVQVHPSHHEFQLGGLLNKKMVGLLGMDFLRHFRLRVEPEESIQLRPRGDLVATAPERIRRWEGQLGYPKCGHPGCIEIGFDRSGAAGSEDLIESEKRDTAVGSRAKASMTNEPTPTGPEESKGEGDRHVAPSALMVRAEAAQKRASYLVSCVDEGDQVSAPLWIRLEFPKLDEGQEVRIPLSTLAKAKDGELQAWARLAKTPVCDDVAVLDMNPSFRRFREGSTVAVEPAKARRVGHLRRPN
jgi:clan AA aspartic protease (TIGR02281 family)